MELAKIHAVSFATRIGQVAAAEIFALLEDEFFVRDPSLWFDQSLKGHPDESARIILCEDILDKMAEYVCKHQVDLGERLYRWATGQRLVASIGDWPDLTFAQRQPWETFTSNCRQSFNDLKAAQLAIVDARRAAPAPAGLKLEDSIFEEVEDTFAMRPEAVEALKLSGIYERGQIAERERLANEAEDQMRAEAEQENLDRDASRGSGLGRPLFNGADPAKFDHDGDGRPGGSRARPTSGKGPPSSAIDKSIERHKRKAKPAPLSAGETVTQPPRNRGGRGNRKTP